MKKLGLLFLTLLLVLGTAPLLANADQATGTPKIKKDKKVTVQLDLTCVKNALIARETTIVAAYGKLSTAISQALAKRQTDLTAAWSKTNAEERRAAIKQAWNDFSKTKKAANKDYKKTVRDAWKKFRQDAKNCKVNPNDESSGLNMGERGDSSLE